MPRISGTETVRTFEKAGWQFARQTGSHIVLRRPGDETTLSIPRHREVAPGLLQAQIKKAGMTVQEFIDLL